MIKWVARLAFLTVILALAGTLLLIRNIHQTPQQEEKRLVQNDSLEAGAPISILPSASIDNDNQVELADSTAAAVTPTNNDTVHLLSVNSSIPEEKLASDILHPVTKNHPKPAKRKRKTRVLTKFELEQLVNRVKIAKMKNGLYSSCIQIYISEHSTNKKALEQIETYFRHKGFTIAGREIISKKINGIVIRPAGACIRLTVGDI